MKNPECLDESMSPTRELQSSRVGMIPYQTQLPAFIIIVIRRFPRNDYVFQAVAKQVRTVCLCCVNNTVIHPQLSCCCCCSCLLHCMLLLIDCRFCPPLCSSYKKIHEDIKSTSQYLYPARTLRRKTLQYSNCRKNARRAGNNFIYKPVVFQGLSLLV